MHWQRRDNEILQIHLCWVELVQNSYDCEIVKTNCNTIVEKYIDLFYDFEKVVKQLEMWVCHLGQVRAPYTNAEVQTQCQALLQIEPPGTLIRPLYLYKCKVEIL